MKRFAAFSVFFIVICTLVSGDLYGQSNAEETNVVVRAQSKDAKFIGTSMGGAMITIKNAGTGKILAHGFTEGSTGDTQKLVRDDKKRYAQLSTPGSAKFDAWLKLSEPTFVTIEAVAPYAKKQAHAVSSTQLWLIPGKDIGGDGIILEIPGFVVDVLSPHIHSTLENPKINIRANIVMMCGCPTSDGGLWDSSEYEINALVKKDGTLVDSVALQFTGETSTFEGVYTGRGNGVYEITVYAYHEKTSNTGVDKTTVILQ